MIFQGGGGSGSVVPSLDPPPMAIRNDKNKNVIESPNTCISTSESCLNGGEECKPIEPTSISVFEKDDIIYKLPLFYVYYCLSVKTKLLAF